MALKNVENSKGKNLNPCPTPFSTSFGIYNNFDVLSLVISSIITISTYLPFYLFIYLFIFIAVVIVVFWGRARGLCD